MADALIITQVYEPEPNFITADVARMLASHGSVTVITAHPNYPLGRFYPEVQGIRPKRTVENGVTVWRLPMYPDHSTSILRRGISYASFLAAALAFAPFVAGRPKLVWIYNTPVTSYLAALPFRWLWKARLVVTVADLWPESLLASEVVREGRVIRGVRRFARWVNRSADLVICATRTTQQTFEAEGIEPDRLRHIPVWTAAAEPRDVSAARARPVTGEPGERHRLVYAGNIGEGQWLDPLIQAAAGMKKLGLPVDVDLYGDGTERERLERMAKELGADNVRFHGRVPPETAYAAAAGALAQIVSLKPSPMFRMTVPSKLMFSFAAGAPILYCLEGEAAEIAAASGAGWRFAPDDPAAIVSAVQRLLAMPQPERAALQQRLQTYYRTHYSRQHLLEQYWAALTGEMPVAMPQRARAAG